MRHETFTNAYSGKKRHRKFNRWCDKAYEYILAKEEQSATTWELIDMISAEKGVINLVDEPPSIWVVSQLLRGDDRFYAYGQVRVGNNKCNVWWLRNEKQKDD